ncbi:MAG TPA: hypothetical protein VF459_12435 [Caulobacteraceae bacterium]
MRGRTVLGQAAFALTATAAVLAGAPALANSLFDYGGFSNASVVMGDNTFRIYVHKSRNTFVLEAAMKDFAKRPNTWPQSDWQAAANSFVRPLGCVVPQTVSIGPGVAWEATYLCPLGVDLPALVKQQGEAVKGGAALRP